MEGVLFGIDWHAFVFNSLMDSGKEPLSWSFSPFGIIKSKGLSEVVKGFIVSRGPVLMGSEDIAGCFNDSFHTSGFLVLGDLGWLSVVTCTFRLLLVFVIIAVLTSETQDYWRAR